MLKLEDIYDVTVAKDGQEAYDMVKASMEDGTVFSLIFMDIQVRVHRLLIRLQDGPNVSQKMPNLDGLQSTRLIRRMGYRAPIVALTAFAEEGNVKECLNSGMDMFLSKPIRRPALQKVLRKFASTSEESETATLVRENRQKTTE
jgi:osomolarity two-component system, sensor histidine kinase SLN1